MSAGGFLYRNFLLKRGVIKYADFTKIHEGGQSSIYSLAHLLQQYSSQDYFDLSQRLYQNFEVHQKVKKLKKLAQIADLVVVKQKSQRFFNWLTQMHFQEFEELFKKLKLYVTKLLKENKELQQSQPMLSNSASFKSVKWQSQSSSQKFSNFTPKGSQLDLKIVSPEQKQQQLLYDRLYQEAFRKKEIINKIREIKQEKEQQQYTFKPQISPSNLRLKGSVFERLSSDDRNRRHQIYQQHSLERQLKECTFAPATNTTKETSTSRQHTPDRLYQQAEETRQKLRSKQILKSEEDQKECTFKPKTNRRSPPRSTTEIYDNLYDRYKGKQQYLRLKELEYQEKELEKCPFTPKLISQQRQTSSTPAHQRLYQEQENRRKRALEREIKQQEEQKQLSNKPINRSQSPAFERLYKQGRKILLESERKQLESSQSSVGVKSLRHSFDSGQKSSIAERIVQNARKANRKALN